MKRFGKGTATLVLLLVTMTTAVGFADDCTSCDYTSVYEICDVPGYCSENGGWYVCSHTSTIHIDFYKYCFDASGDMYSVWCGHATQAGGCCGSCHWVV